ncbi:FKBP-type peptidyl-prolyl cis-trans isomerase [Pinibacter aurantiacus]|uniref:Peptidyl-prolyl cis-trans isomerase n=1 Tax=Pinibacter aurantiacus TaxID=2851599 RepID=A0A9E2W3Q4_9BACT|nr:FKBP-type peptidyl-prolyl cis-trans isomerase [Pinibacter aurantiacus]MBV4357049.1 FKBP-type peptidyl-prolyl cis-trans isomerase [Pinibacter aurantiacus]
MKRFFLLMLAVPVLFLACSKKSDSGCKDQDPSVEAPAMQAFCVTQGLNYQIDTVGNYYQIDSLGTGPSVLSAYDTVVISYVGKTLDNVVFDRGDSVMAYAGTFIPGFQWGLLKVKEGGGLQIVMPSFLAYGCNGNSRIPPNSPLYFSIKLLDVRNSKQ